MFSFHRLHYIIPHLILKRQEQGIHTRAVARTGNERQVGALAPLLASFRSRLLYNDWSLYGLAQMIEYKYLQVGKELHIINERNTTKLCHICGDKQGMPLWYELPFERQSANTWKYVY